MNNSFMFESSKRGNAFNILVSIIIPAYQAEAYIERSTRSALEQTYRNVEVIVIENGSSDKTLEVVRSIHDERLVILQSPKGVSNARNMGIEKCKGEYIFFLDADDWLDRNAIEILISAVNEDVDLVSARYYGDKPFEAYDHYRYDIGNEEYIIKCLCTPTKRGNCTGNLYRTRFIREHGLRFNPKLSHAEDSVFFVKFLVNAPVVIDLEKPIYHVFINPDSVTRNSNRDNSDDFCKAITEVYITLSESSINVINAGYIFALNQLLVILVNSNISFAKLFQLAKHNLQLDIFEKAANNVDLRNVSGVMRLVFLLIKWRMILLLTLVVKVRSIFNTFRMKKVFNE